MVWWMLCYLLFAAACVPGIGVQPRCCNAPVVVYCGCDGPAPDEFLVTLSGVANGTGTGSAVLNDTFVVVKREGCTREGDPANWCCYSVCLDNPDVGAELVGTSGGLDCETEIDPFPPLSGAKLLIVLWLNSSEGDPSSLAFYELRVHTADGCCDPPYSGSGGGACGSAYLEGSFLETAPDADCAAVEDLELPYVTRTCHQYDLSGATCTISAA